MKGLAERIVLVTGGVGLIGSAIARRMLDEKAVVAVSSRKLERAQKWITDQPLEQTDRVYPVELDLSSEDSIRACFDSLKQSVGLPTILIGNASLRDGLSKPYSRLTHQDWANLFNVDAVGHFLCAREMIDRLPSSQRGSIVLLSSIYAVNGTDFRIYPDGMLGTPPQYATVKAALLGLTRDLAARWGSRGIRVNAIIAGGVRSPERQPDPEFLTNYNRRVILGRMAQADEIASAVAFLASEESSYITGEFLHVDGGLSAW